MMLLWYMRCCAHQPPCAAQVAVSINCMSVCGLVHAAIMKTGKLYVAEAEEAEFLGRARRFALQCAPCTLSPRVF